MVEELYKRKKFTEKQKIDSRPTAYLKLIAYFLRVIRPITLVTPNCSLCTLFGYSVGKEDAFITASRYFRGLIT